MPYADPEKRKELLRRRYYRNRDRLRKLMAERGCADCPAKSDWRILEFDHLPGSEGRRKLGRMMNGAWEKIMSEVAKCDIVCANCHCIRTHERGQY